MALPASTYCSPASSTSSSSPRLKTPLRRGRRRSPALADRFLDDFLRLANAHGSFRSATLALQQDLAAARSQSAVATSSASRAVSAPSAALGRSWPSSRRPLENSRRGHSPVPPPGRQPTQRRRGFYDDGFNLVDFSVQFT
ncbi:hypothetical protein OPV22_002458 [Ensete ventricosum]|uniref:Uncharacterized protein n=1 Tax=Ensete ventricosum TaxID=4639 RepID=A0AAV8RXZ1_ENSVE|nr:hypothetical protein OPV22_002458 [Ensete ventricosum]